MRRGLTRRELLLAGGVVAIGGALVGRQALHAYGQTGRRVTTLRAPTYDVDLVDLLWRGLQDFPDVVRRAKGARVVLKPNLVEYDPSRPINTDPRFVAAAAEVFARAGAREVVVAEGPGHRRDTELMLDQSGLGDVLGQIRRPFVDLNADVPHEVPLALNHMRLGKLAFAETVLSADLLVSLPKMKTHHWAAATLSMKNLFGTVPGSVVGWPKNPLHWAGLSNSIVDLWATLQPAFAMVDGIVGMEGDGPIMGSPVPLGVVVMGDHLPAVDATAARLMGLVPERIEYLALASWSGGTIASRSIEVVGDVVQPYPFALLPDFLPLRA